MDAARQAMLAQQALSDIDQLLMTSCNSFQTAHVTTQQHPGERWVDDLITSYKQLGGQATYSEVYRKMQNLRQAAGSSWPEHAQEAIRQTLQAYNADSPRYRGGPNLFRMIRPGLWGLRDT